MIAALRLVLARSGNSTLTQLLGYGGGGHVFDWTLIPQGLPGFLVLSGGLTVENVGEAMRRVRPAAVDVSSGVEMGKGIKDRAKIAAFVGAVRAADKAVNEG